MASERRTDTTRSTNGHDHAGADPAGLARDVAGRTAEVAGDVASRLPAAAASTRDVLNEAQARMNSSSDEVLTNGTMLSLGVALGLLLGGANRLLVALALIPAAAMGATLIDRRSRS